MKKLSYVGVAFVVFFDVNVAIYGLSHSVRVGAWANGIDYELSDECKVTLGAELFMNRLKDKSPHLTRSRMGVRSRFVTYACWVIELAPMRDLTPMTHVKTLSVGQLAKVGYTGKLNYVVTEEGKLVIGRTRHTSLT